MTRFPGAVCAFVLALVAAGAPAQADGGQTTSTGDVDVHSVYVGSCLDDLKDGAVSCEPTLPVCGQAFTAWTVRLTLGETSPGDSVAFASIFDSSLSQAAVATHEDPMAQVVGVTRTTCHPDTAVAGLVVDGELPCVLEFVAH